MRDVMPVKRNNEHVLPTTHILVVCVRVYSFGGLGVHPLPSPNPKRGSGSFVGGTTIYNIREKKSRKSVLHALFFLIIINKYSIL